MSDKKQRLITDYFEPIRTKIYGHDKKTGNWHCIQCGTNMGPNNPRQLCRKTYCDSED